MFTPMALTVLMALAGAMILSLTFVPAAVALFVTGKVAREGEPLHARRARRLRAAAGRGRSGNARSWSSLAPLVLVVRQRLLASRMGGEFIPSLDEGDIACTRCAFPAPA